VTEPTATAIVVIAHGSRAETANEAHLDVCRSLATRTGRRVEPAFLELSEPTLDAAVATLADEGHRRIVVLPYFLYPGRHLTRDIPALVEAAAATHPATTLTIGPLFGADPAVVDVLAGQVASADE